MKKFIKILIVLLVIAAIVLVCLNLFGKKNDENVALDEETALQIAKIRYERLLNYAELSSINFSEKDGNIEIFEFDDNSYFKINNFDDIIKSDLADEFIDEFCKIANIVEKDGNYYVNVENIGREKDSTYISTNIIIDNITEEEIVCTALSTYATTNSNEITTISNNFILKKINNEWKTKEFSIPY